MMQQMMIVLYICHAQIKHFDVICEKLVCSTDECTRLYGCMVTMALLQHQPETCISLLLRRVDCYVCNMLIDLSGILSSVLSQCWSDSREAIQPAAAIRRSSSSEIQPTWKNFG